MYIKNHFHELLHIPGHSADSICQEDMYIVMLRQAISLEKDFQKIGFALTFLRKFLH